jgi:hypothetical protein
MLHYFITRMLCVVISINMYHILNFYVFFLKFVVHEINSEMIKSRMVVRTRRENADVINADMAVS